VLFDVRRHSKNTRPLLHVSREELKPGALTWMITSHNKMSRFLFLLSCALISAGAVGAQSGSSSQNVDKTKVVLTGTVFDSIRSVIPGSQVVVRSFGVREFRATTNDEGIYKIELPLDVYKIEVNAPGFCPKRIEMLRIPNSRVFPTPLDFVLEVAEEDRPCKQRTMINPKPSRRIRQPELFRSIAE
jgi:hypothetical protein